MIDDRLSHAIGRLERAVATLEDTLPPLVQTPPAPSEDPAESQVLRERLEQLEQRHAALRVRTSAAVERLSQLLDGAQGD